MENALRHSLLSTAVLFASADKCALSTVARRCRNDSSFFDRIKNPEKSFTVRTYDEVMGWFHENWPSGVEKPFELHRWAAEFADRHAKAST